MTNEKATDSYVSIDLETTGLRPSRDRIIEIGAVKVIDGQQADTFSTYVNPGRKLEPRITELTGIRQESVDSAPDIGELLPGLLKFLGELPLLGHRILFDYSFLKQAAVIQKLPFEKTGIDTLKLARHFLPDLPDRSLEYLSTHYGITHQAHRAGEDARAASELYQILAAQFFSPEEKLFIPQMLTYRAKKETPATKPQKEWLYRLIEQHRLNVDYDVEKLTRSEASRYVDKILAAHGRSCSPTES